VTGCPQLLVSVVGPVHPVLQGPPLIQLLDRVIVPLPHRTEQALKGPQAPILDGTTGVPHDLVSVLGPWHGVLHWLPWIQLRDRVIVPVPHRTEQALHGPYAPIRDGTTGVPHDLVSVVGPVQPVLHSLPRIQALDLVIVPVPHRTEQELHGPNAPIRDGTIGVPHDLVSVLGPWHGVLHWLPWIQLRDRVMVPVPHRTEQALHGPYAPIREGTTGVPQDLVSVVGPVHPVLHSLPLIHALDLVIVPVPHRTEHALHGPNAPIREGTTALPQDLVSVVGPVHPVLQGPPLIQLRDRVIVPLPHRTEQALKGPHAPIRDGTTGDPHDLVSVVGPVHPVLHSLPLIHALDRVMVPVPHRTEQALHGPNAPILDATIGVPHDLVSLNRPVHPVLQGPP